MAVFRIEKTRDYTVMANHHLRNTALSLKAKGLLSLMLSLPEDWDYTTKGLARICRDGVDSICATVRELEDAGYIIRERVRNANGRLGSIEYTILEQPRPPEPKPGKPERENPVQVKPVLDSPVLGKPEQEKPAQLNTKGSSNQISNTDSSSTEGCELCGRTDVKLEIHHVNKVKNLKGKEAWEQVMIAKQRKTLAVCHDCHQKIHHGF